MDKVLKFLGPTFINVKAFGFDYGIQGILLRQNFEKLWFQKCVTMSKYNVFILSSNTLVAHMKNLSNLGLDNLPFGIAEIDTVTNSWNLPFLTPNMKSIQHKIAKVTTVYSNDKDIGNVKDLFYKKQRERKTWWRGLSENPSIYYMSEIKTERNKEYVEIEAQFPFGNILVETIHFKKNVKKFLPHVKDSSNLRIVEHITSLDWACLTLLCDGFTDVEGCNELHIHPKLSPYKAYCKVVVSPEDDELIRKDLADLTLYVIELLREQGIESVIVNNTKSPEIFKVPYIVTVSNDSLKTGLINLVCQRTLCGETVHISDMAHRMHSLCA